MREGRTLLGGVLLLGIVFLGGCYYPGDYYDPNLPYSHQKNSHLVPGVEKNEQKDGFVEISAVGIGIEPESGSSTQKKVLARRAAVVDAYRNLSERLTGMIIESYTSQGKNEIDIDRITSETSSYLRGAKVLGVDHDNGMATATIRVTLRANRLIAYGGDFSSQNIDHH